MAWKTKKLSKAARIQQTTASLSYKFQFRRLVRPNEALSNDKVDFALQFLLQETKLGFQPWWQALGCQDRQELLRHLQFFAVDKRHSKIFPLQPHMTRAYIIIRGSGHGDNIETQERMEFTDGSVIGSIALPEQVLESHFTQQGWNALSVKSSHHMMAELELEPLTEYIVLDTKYIEASLQEAAADILRGKLLQVLGLGNLAPFVRTINFEPGMIIAKRGDKKSKLYIVVDGECRAFYYLGTDEDEKFILPSGFEAPRSKRREIASLGPHSLIGDIAILFNSEEPIDIEAVGRVEVRAIDADDFLRAMSSHTNRLGQMASAAYSTLRFIMERMLDTLGTNNSSQRQIFERHCQTMLTTLRPPLPCVTFGTPKSSEDDNEEDERLTKKADVFNWDSKSTTETSMISSKRLSMSMCSLQSPFRASICQTIHRKKSSDNLARASVIIEEDQVDPSLFPTMTRRRHLHAKNLPLVHRTSGYQTPLQGKRSSIDYHVFYTASPKETASS